MTFEIRGSIQPKDDNTPEVFSVQRPHDLTPLTLEKVEKIFCGQLRGKQHRLKVYIDQETRPTYIFVTHESAQKLLEEVGVKPSGFLSSVGKTVAAVLRGQSIGKTQSPGQLRLKSEPSTALTIGTNTSGMMSSTDVRRDEKRLRKFGLQLPSQFKISSGMNVQSFWDEFLKVNQKVKYVKFPSDITENEAKFMGEFLRRRKKVKS